tara:strand:- start:18598 stop:20154 length:1557 start_codon:yes stop_codon:yes gene_type:complete
MWGAFMAAKKHYVVIGRVSDQIRDELINEFGQTHEFYSDFDVMPLDQLELMKQRFTSQNSMFGDREAYSALFRMVDRIGEMSAEEIETENLRRQQIWDALEGQHVTYVSSASGDNISARNQSNCMMSFTLTKPRDLGGAGVDTLTMVNSYTPYMRNDRKSKKPLVNDEGEITARLDEYNADGCDFNAHQYRSNGVSRYVSFTEHSQDGIDIFNGRFGYMPVGETGQYDGVLPATVGPYDGRSQNFLMHNFNVAMPEGNYEPNAQFISPATLFAKEIRSLIAGRSQDVVVCAPDGMEKFYTDIEGNITGFDQGVERAKALRDKILGMAYEGSDPFEDPHMAFIKKTRMGQKSTVLSGFKVGGKPAQNGEDHPEYLSGKIAVITDDIISSGGTLKQAAKKLKDNGAERVIVAVTHGVLVKTQERDAILELGACEDIDDIIITDTIPSAGERLKMHILNAMNEKDQPLLDQLFKFKTISVAPLVVEAIYAEHHKLGLEGMITERSYDFDQKSARKNITIAV